jgi:hypothetical protein
MIFEIENIQVGDTVLIAGVVTKMRDTGITLRLSGGALFDIGVHEIVEHRPALFKPKIGQTITWGTGSTEWLVIGIDGGYIGVRLADATLDSRIWHSIAGMSNLRIVNKAAIEK